MRSTLSSGGGDILPGFVFAGYVLFLVGFFYIPNAVDLYKYYTVAVLLPGLFLLSDGWRLLMRNPLFLAILAYLCYMLLTPLWGEGFEWRAYLNYLRLALYVLVFIMVTVVLHQRWPERFSEMLRIASLLVATAGLVSVLLWFGGIIPGPRLIGLGILMNPNPSGYAYAVFAIMNLFYAGDQNLQKRHRVLHLAAFLILVAYVFFTYSRGALLALLAASLVMFLCRHSRIILIAMVLVLTGGVLIYFEYSSLFTLLDRGIGSRPDIWKIVIARIGEAPFWGHGYLSDQYVNLPRLSKSVFSHNAYLATLRDGGIIGGLLMLGMLGIAAHQAWITWKTTGDLLCLALLILALICMMFDTDRLLTRPRELWIVLWLPIGLILSNYLRVRNLAVHTEQNVSVPDGHNAPVS